MRWRVQVRRDRRHAGTQRYVTSTLAPLSASDVPVAREASPPPPPLPPHSPWLRTCSLLGCCGAGSVARLRLEELASENAVLRTECEALRAENEALRAENAEFRQQLLEVVGFLSSKGEDARLLEEFEALYRQVMEEADQPSNMLREQVPRLYALMGRLPDEAVHAQYAKQTAILMADESTLEVSVKARGVVEGVAIKLGEMMDEPRHVRLVGGGVGWEGMGWERSRWDGMRRHGMG